MINIQLPATFQGSVSAPRTISYPYNMYNIGGSLFDRARYEPFADFDGGIVENGSPAVRGFGMFSSEINGGNLYAIYERTIYRIAFDTGAQTVVATFDAVDVPVIGSSPAPLIKFPMARSFTGMCISTGIGNYFFEFATETLTKITDPDLPATRSVDFIDGRFVWVTRDGESIFHSEPLDPFTIIATSFFDAELRPDKNINSFVIGNTLFIAGENSIERFRSTGDNDLPFARSPSGVIPIGLVGNLTKLSDKAYFLGRPSEGSVAFYEMSLNGIREISTPEVMELISETRRDLEAFSFTLLEQTKETIDVPSWSEYGRTVINAFSDFYCMIGGDGIRWGFLERADGLDSGSVSTDFEAIDPLTNPTSSGIFRSSILYGDCWLVQTGQIRQTAVSAINSVGIYKVQSDSSQDELNTITDGSGQFNRGFRTVFRNETDKDFSLSSIRFTLSSQNESEFAKLTDVIKVKISESGRAGTFTEIETENIAFQDGADIRIKESARALFQGGIIRGYTSVVIVISVRSSARVNIEKVIING